MRVAVHMRGGGRGTVELIDAWLARHGFDTRGCADAYQACAHLLLNAQEVPELVFIGVDRLPAAEFVLLDYVRQTWPGVGLVVYATDAGVHAPRPGERTECCHTRGALQQLLNQSPEELLARLRGRPLSDSAETPRAARGAAPMPDAPASPTRDSPADADGPDEPADSGSVDASPACESHEPRLTRDELAALLGDE